jgi:hypothetical protein
MSGFQLGVIIGFFISRAFLVVVICLLLGGFITFFRQQPFFKSCFNWKTIGLSIAVTLLLTLAQFSEVVNHLK